LLLSFIASFLNLEEHDGELVRVKFIEVPHFDSYGDKIFRVIERNSSYTLCIIWQLQKAHLIIIKRLEA